MPAFLPSDIDAVSFALIDTNLYLDTHPNDKKAMDHFNQYNLTTFSYHTDSLPARPFPIKWFIQLWKDRSTL